MFGIEEGNFFTHLVIVRIKGRKFNEDDINSEYFSDDISGALELGNGLNKIFVSNWRGCVYNENTMLIATTGAVNVDWEDFIKAYELTELNVMIKENIAIQVLPYFYDQSETSEAIKRIYKDILKNGASDVKTLCNITEESTSINDDAIDWIFDQ